MLELFWWSLNECEKRWSNLRDSPKLVKLFTNGYKILILLSILWITLVHGFTSLLFIHCFRFNVVRYNICFAYYLCLRHLLAKLLMILVRPKLAQKILTDKNLIIWFFPFSMLQNSLSFNGDIPRIKEEKKTKREEILRRSRTPLRKEVKPCPF